MRSSITITHAGWRWFRWRGLILVLVFLAGLLAFIGGAEVSEMDIRELGILGKAYYTIGLFILAGIDIGVPSVGPGWAQAMLWFAYFAAPAITTSAVV